MKRFITPIISGCIAAAMTATASLALNIPWLGATLVAFVIPIALYGLRKNI